MWLPRSPLGRDALLGVSVTIAAQLELAMAAPQPGSVRWAHHVSSLLILPALTLRRRAPLAASLIAAVGLALDPLIGPAVVALPFLALLFLIASLGWYTSMRRGVIGVVATLVCGLAPSVIAGSAAPADIVVNSAIVVLTWGASHGLRVATDRRVAAELGAAASARAAAAHERDRIARDLHDSLAHALTIITLQAGSARERDDPEVASSALAAIEHAGREALADMHRFLGLLGPSDGDAHGTADIPDLVERVRGGGLQVALHLDAGTLPASVSAAVYRVVQEGLTNVVRHSGSTAAEVVVERSDGELVTVVSDNGTRRSPDSRGGGHGLTGLASRLELYGGTVRSAPTSEGWRLEARIPLLEPTS